MNIKLFAMDVDGTLTDGKIYMGDNGEVFKSFDVKDGLGIHDMLKEHNIIPVIITGRNSKIVENRCKELGVQEVFQGVKDKTVLLDKIVKKYNSEYKMVSYIGDDLNDLEVMKNIKTLGGLTACPSDSAKEILEISSYVCGKKGGEGAVREFIEYILCK